MALAVLEVRISQILSHAVGAWSDSGMPFLVARIEGRDRSEGNIIKGEMRTPVIGQLVRFFGEWKIDTKYNENKYFRFVSFEPLIDRTDDGIITYLIHHIPNVGIRHAGRIVGCLGLDTIDILRQDAAQIATVPGLPAHTVQSVQEHFSEILKIDPYAYAALSELVSGLKVARRVVEALCLDFRSNAVDMIHDHPYLLLSYPRMGWKTVDKIAVERCGFPPRGLERQVAALLEALRRASVAGHTWSPRAAIEYEAFGLVKFRPSPEAWNNLAASRQILLGSDWVAEARYIRAEQNIAYHLGRLRRAWPDSLRVEGLEEEQVEAVETIAGQAVAILTGPPGSGKSYSVAHVLKSMGPGVWPDIQVIAPTGKAAQRMEELLRTHLSESGIPSQTCHRALGVCPSEAPPDVPEQSARFGRGRPRTRFRHDVLNPWGRRIVVLSEASMVDAELMAAVLAAIPDGGRLLIEGDEHQLPSVRPGAVLRDMIAGGVPTGRLVRPRRNAGQIAEACYDIKQGRTPTFSLRPDLVRGKNLVHIEKATPEEIVEEIVRLIQSSSRDPISEIQVISPEKQNKPIACSHLNDVLSRLLNPAGRPELDLLAQSPELVVGDKVVRVSNGVAEALVETRLAAPVERQSSRRVDSSGNLVAREVLDWNNPDLLLGPEMDGNDFDWNSETEGLINPGWEYEGKYYQFQAVTLVNGDMGQVVGFGKEKNKKYVIVRFFSLPRLVRLPVPYHDLILAYCVTVHKFQGSGCRVIIFPLHEIFNPLLVSRELVYTAFSRAEELLITVGTTTALRAAVTRKTVNLRRTTLQEFLTGNLRPGLPSDYCGQRQIGWNEVEFDPDPEDSSDYV